MRGLAFSEPKAPGVATVWPSSRAGCFVQYVAMPFPAGGRRQAVGAVKAAFSAFIGAKRRALTEEAGGPGAGLGRKGKKDPTIFCRFGLVSSDSNSRPSGS